MNKPFWYKHPQFLSSKEWQTWRETTKKKYPVQYFLREMWSDAIYWCKRKKEDIYYTIRSWFAPAHPIIRKSIPRRWVDLTELLVTINFAIILQFKLEADGSYVDWDADENHIKFKKWLDDSVDYIRNQRVILEKQLDAAYPEVDLWGPSDNTPYETKYAEVIRLETLINDTDTKILKEMIDFRDFFWT